MKQRLFSRLFIVLPAALCLSILSIGNAFAAEPVTIRYEVTSHQTDLGFVTCHNQDGPRTELLSEGTRTWSYQFTTTNPGQAISVYPVPVDNPNAAISLVSKVYINGVLYKTAAGQNAAAASIHDTLDNLRITTPAHQWDIRYEVATEQTTLGFLTYSNNHTPGQAEILAAGTTTWNYQYTTTNPDQPINIEAVPVVPNDPDKFYAVVIKVFVNNNLLYYATFNSNTQRAIVDVKLDDLLAIGQAQVPQGTVASASNQYSSVEVIPGILLGQATTVAANYPVANPYDPYAIDFRSPIFRNPDEVHTAGFSFFTNDSYFFFTIVTGQQPLQTPEFEGPEGTLLALVPQKNQ
jgi:hypothetical protein